MSVIRQHFKKCISQYWVLFSQTVMVQFIGYRFLIAFNFFLAFSVLFLINLNKVNVAIYRLSAIGKQLQLNHISQQF